MKRQEREERQQRQERWQAGQCCRPCRFSRPCGALAALLLVLAPSRAPAQDAGALVAEATTLERGGRYEAAAARYRAALQTDPANIGALLGLERVYPPLNRLDSLIPPIRAALQRDPASGAVHGLELRTWLALGRRDSMAAAAQRWIALAPRSAEPYREWAYDLAQQGELAAAKRVLGDGNARVGNEVLKQDLAQLSALSGQWGEASQQWVLVVRANSGLLTMAAATLARAPDASRDDVLGALVGAGADSISRLLAAELLVTWDRADEAWPLLDANLPADPRVAASLLQHFADQAAATRSRKGALVRGYALERLATLVDAVAAGRIRLQAAQAYGDGGDIAAAQRMLTEGGAAGDSSVALAPAMVSVIRATAEHGAAEDAERQLEQWSDRLSGDDREALREAIAQAWIGKGDLDRAEHALAADSSVAAAAVRGWIALYRGDLAAARARFREAGPYSGPREEATRRMGTLVLLERVDSDRLPDLGHAMEGLAGGDTASAVAGLVQAAGRLPANGGRAEVLAFAGQLALARHDAATAQSVLGEALAADSAAPSAPAAMLALAAADAQTGRPQQATQRLEHLILAYPESAIVPQARRMLDQLRGAVP
jgi:tetratricopeptide (TPR) repeat protein